MILVSPARTSLQRPERAKRAAAHRGSKQTPLQQSSAPVQSLAERFADMQRQRHAAPDMWCVSLLQMRFSWR